MASTVLVLAQLPFGNGLVTTAISPKGVIFMTFDEPSLIGDHHGLYKSERYFGIGLR
jgi:hypothetical protein